MIRSLLLGLILAYSTSVQATTYYVSYNGNDQHSGRSPQQAWRSLKRVNQAIKSLRPGDVVLFRRGDRFAGSLLVTQSGASGSPIRFGAYGSGDRPIIDGFHRLSNWKSLGGNRWKASYQAPQKVNTLFINLQFQPIGRYPNINSANRGYLTINGGDGRTQFSSSALSGSWGGGEAVIRSRRWILDRIPIASQSGQRITVAQPTHSLTENGFGFFIVNHPNALDQNGEWAYKASTKEVYLYSQRDPNTRAVVVPRVASLITLRDQHDIMIEDLDLWGSSAASVYMRNCQRVTLRRCRIFGSGQNGISVEYGKDVRLLNNSLLYTNNNGIEVNQGSTRTEVAYNTLRYTGTGAGMGLSGNNSYIGIRSKSSYVNIHHNTINEVGHSGISFVGENVNIQYNNVTNFCKVKDDGAGIYAGLGSSGSSPSTQIKYNIVGDGNPPDVAYGTSNLDIKHINGVYCDRRNNNVVIEGNTMYRCAYFGLFLHNSRNVRIIRNVMYDNRRAFGMMHSKKDDPAMRGIWAQDNEMFSLHPSQEIMQLYSATDDQYSFGNIDNNYYYSPLKQEEVIRISDVNFNSKLYSVAQWKQVSPYDKSTRTNAQLWPTLEIKRYLSANLLPNANFTSNLQNWQMWSSQGNGIMRHGNGTLDGGSLVMQFSGGAGSSLMAVSPSQGMGSVRKGEHYVLRYTTKSNGNNENFSAKIGNRRGAYAVLSNTHTTSTSTQRRNLETFFAITNSHSDAVLKFNVNENKQQLHIDNVELRRVETQSVNYDEYVQFLTNPSTKKNTFSLPGGTWQSLRGQTYQGSVTLEPFKSLIVVNSQAGSTQRTQELVAKSIDGDEDLTEGSDDALRVSIYPNPLRDDFLTVTVRNPDENAKVQIYDADGKLLWQQEQIAQADLRLPRTSIGPGLRLIKVITSTEVVTEKVIVY